MITVRRKDIGERLAEKLEESVGSWGYSSPCANCGAPCVAFYKERYLCAVHLKAALRE
jgi:hypothetical protein